MSEIIKAHFEALNDLTQALELNGSDQIVLEKKVKEAEKEIQEVKLRLVTVNNKQQKDNYLEQINYYQKKINRYSKSLLTGSGQSSKNSCRPAEEKGQESLEILKKSQAQLAATEVVGKNTLTNLQEQKEKIKKINENCRQINDELAYSTKLVNSINKWYRG
jgi:orotidine-5'-phosphate decarboxylase